MRHKKKPFDDEPALDFPDNGHDVTGESGSTATAGSPIRTCVVERERKADSDLLRFVLSPAGEVVPDLKRNLPGRGVWLTPTKEKVAEAIKRRAFDRGFRQKVHVNPDLPGLVEGLMRKSAVESLAMANKAGLVVTGFEKVAQAIRAGEIVILVHAVEAARDGRSKLEGQLARSLDGKSYTEPKICLTSAEISLATGRLSVIHAGLREGGASRAFLRAIERLLRYQGQPQQAHPPVQDEV
jgi:hypothetical protein